MYRRMGQNTTCQTFRDLSVAIALLNINGIIVPKFMRMPMFIQIHIKCLFLFWLHLLVNTGGDTLISTQVTLSVVIPLGVQRMFERPERQAEV